MKQFRCAALLVLALAWSGAQAGVLEDLLALPAIQSLLARQVDIRSALLRCGDPNYQQRNAIACQRAEEARRLAAMPHELRLLMANPPAAASLRELCLAVQGGPTQGSYLCVELYRAETQFRQLADQQRNNPFRVQRQPGEPMDH